MIRRYKNDTENFIRKGVIKAAKYTFVYHRINTMWKVSWRVRWRGMRSYLVDGSCGYFFV